MSPGRALVAAVVAGVALAVARMTAATEAPTQAQMQAALESWDIEHNEDAAGFRLRLPAAALPDLAPRAKFEVHAWYDERGDLVLEFTPVSHHYTGLMREGTVPETATAWEPPGMDVGEWDLPHAVLAPVTPTPAADVMGMADGGVRTLRAPSFTERDRGVSRDGIRLAQRGQLLAAYEVLQAFIVHHPEAHISRETLITLLFAQQEHGRANRLLAEGLALAPHHGGYKKLQARLWVREGAIEDALALLLQAPPTLETDLEYHDLLASLRQQSGDHEGAVEVYQRLLAGAPGHARWWAAMAISLEALGRARDAITSYQQALRSQDLDPDLRRYSLRRIEVLERR